MKRLFGAGVLVLLFLGTREVSAQLLRNTFPGSSISAQHAGSIGLASIGWMRHTHNERIGVGLWFGHTPRSHGGSLSTWALRFMYTPWKVDVGEHLLLEPIQVGVFVAYTAGLDLRTSWPSHLEKGYYWWFPNFRQHLHVRSQLGWRAGKDRSQRLAAYLEVNTNDLYVYSWWPNRKSISVGDIVFLGAGMQYYLKPFAPKPRRCQRDRDMLDAS